MAAFAHDVTYIDPDLSNSEWLRAVFLRYLFLYKLQVGASIVPNE